MTYNQTSLVAALHQHGFNRISLPEPSNHHVATLTNWVDPACKGYESYQDPNNGWFGTFSPTLQIAITSDTQRRKTWTVYPENRVLFPGRDAVRNVLFSLLLLEHWMARRRAEGWQSDDPANVRWTLDDLEGLSFGDQDCFLLGIKTPIPGTDLHTTPLIRLEDLNIAALEIVKRFILSVGGCSRQMPPRYWVRAQNSDHPLAGDAFHNDDREGSPSHGYGKKDAANALAILHQTDTAWQLWTNPEERWIYIVKPMQFDLEASVLSETL